MALQLSPFGPVAGAFCLDNSRASVIMGPVGSAKTTAAAYRLARHAYEQHVGPHGIAWSRWAIVRNTGPQLHDTTMKSWFKLFPENGPGMKYERTTKTHKWHFKPKGWNKVVHAEFIFRALDDEDDVANLLSLEVTGFWFNEIREINTQILAHAGRRAGRYPGADMGGCTWRGWLGDTNPWPFTADLHEMFVTNPRDGYKFFKQPGGMDPDAENLENLEQTPETLKLPYNDPVRREQGRTYYINALQDFSKDDGDMYVHCKYGASRSGKPVFVSYNDNTHCKPFELTRADKHVPLLIGYDNTGRNPAAVIAQKTDVGQWRVRYEFVGEGIGLKAHAEALKKFLEEKIPGYTIDKITCDPAGRAKGADDLDMPAVIRSVFKGVTVLNARTNDPATRIEAVEGRFRAMINGEPAILIHPDCKILRTACISGYRYRKLKVTGDERYAEEPEKNHPFSDVADGLQYLMLGGGEGKAAVGTGNDWTAKGQAVQPQKKWDPLSI